MSEGRVLADGEQSEDQFWDIAIDLPDKIHEEENKDHSTTDNARNSNKMDVITDGDERQCILIEHENEESQIEDDFKIAQVIQASLDNVVQVSTQELQVEGTLDKLATYSDHISVIQTLEQQAITTDQFFSCCKAGNSISASDLLVAT